eukprot:NODE_27_length_33950_cov_0.349739.p7 type:complete len:529 gc:universal NODE_27_length_33950_cov_0.349739:4178-2592(-)
MLLSFAFSLTIQLAGVPEDAVQVQKLILLRSHLNMVAWYDELGNLVNRQHVHDACSSSINRDGSWAIGTPNFVTLGSGVDSSPYTIPVKNGCLDLMVQTIENKLSIQISKSQYICTSSCSSASGLQFSAKPSPLKIESLTHGYQFGNVKIKSHCEIKKAFQLSNGYLAIKQCGAMSYVNNQGAVEWIIEQGMTRSIDALYFEQPAVKQMKNRIEHEDIFSALIDRYTTHLRILLNQLSFEETIKPKNLELLLVLSGPTDPSLYIVNQNGTLNRKIMLFDIKGLELFKSKKLYYIDSFVYISGLINSSPTLIKFSTFKDSLVMDTILFNTNVIKNKNKPQIIKSPVVGHKVLTNDSMIHGLELQSGEWKSKYKIPIPKDFVLVGSVNKPLENVAKYVIGDEIKFAPNLKAYLWYNAKDSILAVWGIDAINGRSYIYGVLNNAFKPFTITMSENFVYVTYMLNNIQSVGVVYEMIFASTPPLNWSYDTIESPKVKMRQTIIDKGPFSASTVTQTTLGVAYRDIIGIPFLI